MRTFLKKCHELIKEGFKDGWRHHRWYILGWIATWLFPLAALSTYMGMEASKKPKISFEPWLLIVLIVLLIIYYKKVKATMKTKLQNAQIKGVPANPLWYLLNGAASVVAVAVVYWLTRLLTQFNLNNLLTYLLFCMTSIGFGALCYAIDAVNNLSRHKAGLQKEGTA